MIWTLKLYVRLRKLYSILQGVPWWFLMIDIFLIGKTNTYFFVIRSVISQRTKFFQTPPIAWKNFVELQLISLHSKATVTASSLKETMQIMKRIVWRDLERRASRESSMLRWWMRKNIMWLRYRIYKIMILTNQKQSYVLFVTSATAASVFIVS